MKLICSKEQLIDGINIVQKAISSKPAIPILEGILLEVSDKFKLTGNDLEMGIEYYVEADIKERGSIVLNSKMFGDVIRRLPESEVLLEVKENKEVIIECENSHFQLKGLSSEGYPALPEIKKENSFKVSQKILREMIRQTVFAVGIDENRPILTGSLIESNENELIFVSIDGFRMALRKSKRENTNSKFSVVVPGKTLNEIVKIMQPVDEEITIYNSKNQILIDTGNYKIVSRIIDGEYLNYNSIIPNDFETKIRINRRDILASFERAYLITTEDKKYPVKFNIKDEMIVISSTTEIGAVREEIVTSVSGSNMDIGFNPKYFIEALRVIEDDEIEIYFTSSIGPCTIRPIKGEDYAYMILPIRIKND